MLIRTETNDGVVGDVRYIEGAVAFQNIKLNVFCFVTDGILIDTGAPRLLEDFKPFFADNRFEKVVITHAHEDHSGGAAYIQKQYDVPIYLNEKGMEECAQKADYPFYRRYFWGDRMPFQAEPLGKTFESINATWDVIETPGHADDHLAFLNRETGQLFSGDLFVQPQTKLMLKNESVPTMMASIRRVLTYDFQEMFCCHAGYVKNGREMLEKKLIYLEELTGEIQELHKKGFNEKEIRKKIFGKKHPISYISFGEWDSLHIIHSVLAKTYRG